VRAVQGGDTGSTPSRTVWPPSRRTPTWWPCTTPCGLHRHRYHRPCYRGGRACGAAIVGIVPVDTVKQVQGKKIRGTLNRDRLVLAQTPQIFSAVLLRRAYAKANERRFCRTDESSLVERLDEVEVSVVNGSDRNIKSPSPPTWSSPASTWPRKRRRPRVIADLRTGLGWDNHGSPPDAPSFWACHRAQRAGPRRPLRRRRAGPRPHRCHSWRRRWATSACTSRQRSALEGCGLDGLPAPCRGPCSPGGIRGVER